MYGPNGPKGRDRPAPGGPLPWTAGPRGRKGEGCPLLPFPPQLSKEGVRHPPLPFPRTYTWQAAPLGRRPQVGFGLLGVPSWLLPPPPPIYMWEGQRLAQQNIVLAVCGAPSTVYTVGHIFVLLRRSPAEIASPPPSARHRVAGTHLLLRLSCWIKKARTSPS